MAWEERMHTIERNDKSELKQKLPTPASRDYCIKTKVEAFYKKIILKNFAIYTGKHLCWSPNTAVFLGIL